MQQINDFFTLINGYLWGWPMIVLLLGTHLFLSVRLRFPQRKILKAIRLSVSKDKDSTGDVSQFGALATALAATIGTGNIVGVALAVTTGGPGAVFWCWICGFFGMATKYSEALLAVKYRVKDTEGRMLGGPMYALERGLHQKWLAVLFAIFTALAAFGIGCIVQANAISTISFETYGITHWMTGLFITILAAAVLLGGVKRIASVCGKLVPFMAAFYVIGCVVLLYMNRAYL
ncbi:MAG: sodium:alanine symporter family protein, partial [Bacteroidaceae bacterium]|nr:sodium:alanine symporter family protein [Bacteroidaceae bacterium]